MSKIFQRKFLCFRRNAQATVEYLMLLAMIAGGAIMFFILFYRKIIGIFFTIVGLILGAGTPKQG
ncbi:MAG: hypothetical protein K6357_01715 [Elusimicrobiota bacterium]